MKCFNCKKEIKNEIKSIHIGDGDFVCDDKCKKEYIKLKDVFLKNIGNDKWYKNYL